MKVNLNRTFKTDSPAVVRIPRVSLKDVRSVIAAKFHIYKDPKSIIGPKFDTVKSNLCMVRQLLAGPLYIENVRPGTILNQGNFGSGGKVLLDANKWAGRKTSCGFYSNADIDEVISVFIRLNISKYRSFVDLGSGMGDMVFIAKLFGVMNVIGFEKDILLYAISKIIKWKMVGLLPEIKESRLIWGSYLKGFSFKEHNAAFIYPDSSENLMAIIGKFAIEAGENSILMIYAARPYSDFYSIYYSQISIGNVTILIRNSLPLLS